MDEDDFLYESLCVMVASGVILAIMLLALSARWLIVPVSNLFIVGPAASVVQ
jgi:hypothetical protein